MENAEVFKQTLLREDQQLNSKVLDQRLKEGQATGVGANDAEWLTRELDMFEASMILEQSEQQNKSFVSLAKNTKTNSLFYKEKNGKYVAKSRFEIKETKEEIAKYRSNFIEEKNKVKQEEGVEYYKEKLASDYKAFNITDKEIEQYIAEQLQVKSLTQVKAELECVKVGEFFKPEESLVHVSQEQIKEFGAAGRVQHLPAIVARKIVTESKGYVTMVANGDGTYKLRPSLPSEPMTYKVEEQVETGMPPVTYDVEISNLRETYNLYCKFYAYCMINSNLLETLKLEDVPFGVYGQRSGFVERGKDNKLYLKSSIQKILVDLGADDIKLADFLNFLIIMHKDEKAFGGASEFQTGAVGAFRLKSAARERLALKMDFTKEKQRYAELYDIYMASPTIEEKLYLLGGEKLTGAELDKKVDEIYEEFINQAETVQKELEIISGMDISNPEIALFGACSANANFMRKFVNKQGTEGSETLLYRPTEYGSRFDKHGLEDLKYRKNYFLHELENPGLSEETVKEYTSNVKMIDAFLNKVESGQITFDIKHPEVVRISEAIYSKMTTFNHHAASVIYENAEFVITTEAFAAETNQFMVSPLQRGSSYVGIYRKKEEDRQYGFINYYGEDMSANYGIRQLKEEMVQKIAQGIKI